jgi:hypothetical protein
MLFQKNGQWGGTWCFGPIWGVFHNIGLAFANKGLFSIMLLYVVCNIGPNKNGVKNLSLVPKRYKSIFVYSRKMQSKFEIYWEMH